ncbi:MAG TPA: hypothetical protein VFO83_07785 [Aggregicoccus sp.]|nr:hypothetical protein [Aggregicoccus sp.]
MIRLEKTAYGLRTTAPGFLTVPETQAWLAEIKALSAAMPGPFTMLVDIRTQGAQAPAVAALIQEAMVWVRAHGMKRSAVVLDQPLAHMQITRLARSTGVHVDERYFDASSDPDWETKAMAWLVEGREPG